MSLSQALNQFAQNLGRYPHGASLRLAGFRPHGIQPTTGTPLFFRAEK